MAESVPTRDAGIFTSLRQRVDYQGFMLGFLCALVTLLLLVGEQFTAQDIEQRVAEDRLALLQELLPSSMYDNQPLAEDTIVADDLNSVGETRVYLAKKGRSLSAVIFQMMAPGWGGDINMMIALDVQGQILGLRVLNHKETPGLADKIETDKSDWITTFNGRSLSNTSESKWYVKKDGGEFDQFTGATITPRAVVGAVHKSLLFFQRNEAQIQAQSTATDSPANESSDSIEVVTKGEVNDVQ